MSGPSHVVPLRSAPEGPAFDKTVPDALVALGFAPAVNRAYAAGLRAGNGGYDVGSGVAGTAGIRFTSAIVRTGARGIRLRRPAVRAPPVKTDPNRTIETAPALAERLLRPAVRDRLSDGSH
jgi:hypothetical protein